MFFFSFSFYDSSFCFLVFVFFLSLREFSCVAVVLRSSVFGLGCSGGFVY